jgi:drug/metabolite transporter (DMT)-like permease
MTYIGEIAALATAFFWSLSSILFTKAGQLIGSISVNLLRLVAAFIYLIIISLILGFPVLQDIEPYRWFWLSVSGIIGVALGDLFLFQAFLMIGPRLSMLLMGLSPIFTALLGWIWLGEKLSIIEMIAITITISGVAWVIIEKNSLKTKDSPDKRNYMLGILLGICSAITQTLGFIASKKGLAGNFSPITGTLIRIFAASIIIWSITILTGQTKPIINRVRSYPSSLRFILVGAFVGPFLGITFSMVAIQNTPVGVASTLMALSPIFLLPIGYLVFHERFGWQSFAGTLLAVAGVAALFLF